MKVLYGLDQVPELPGPSSIAIGNFDGMHLGHHKILRFLGREARKKKKLSVVMTFYPHPRSVLGSEPAPLIQTLDQRLEEMGRQAIDMALILPFDNKFAEITAESFVKDILLERLKAEEIIVGENFFFGRNREGSVAFLKTMAPRFGFEVFSCSPVKQAGSSISSSTIRTLLSSGRIEEANSLLGRAYSIDGQIVGGRSQGRTLGFPTANIRTPNEILPAGVYITSARLSGRLLPSITNLGACPTFGENNQTSIECYLIDFQADVYGREIRLYFLKKLRDEFRFPSPEDLTQQLQKDLRTARLYFKDRPPNSIG
jgi:riboflavin kinase/FMN adenylyltransferase